MIKKYMDDAKRRLKEKAERMQRNQTLRSVLKHNKEKDSK